METPKEIIIFEFKKRISYVAEQWTQAIACDTKGINNNVYQNQIYHLHQTLKEIIDRIENLEKVQEAGEE